MKEKIITGYCAIISKMLENEELLKKIIEGKNLSYVLNIGTRSYTIENLRIAKGKIPVHKPTTRGGVYFSDTTAYKVNVILSDLSIKNEIPKLMLGPNTDFAPIQIRTKFNIDGVDNVVSITTHLTNAVNTKERVEFNLIVDRVDLK